MIQSTQDPAPKFQAVIRSNVEKTPQWASLDPEIREGIEVLSLVLPFRTNKYVMDELIDWTNVPNDPIFNLVFPRSGMLEEDEFNQVRDLVRCQAEKAEINAAVERIRDRLNPHPAGQMTHNVPHVDGEPIPGLQHKYRETVLFFPAHGQTCHAYCTFCFRWAQFIGDEDLKFANKEVDQLVRYLRQHQEVTDVLFTGGDPMVMKAKVLERYIRPILEDPELEHIRTIRIGTKSVAYWPQRYVSDADADDVLRLFEDVVKSGRTLGIMGHYSHGVELKTDVSREAIRRIRSTGANIRMQSPVIRHVNDNPGIWKDMWREGADQGLIPYYMFVERDTGPKKWFELPLVDVWNIFREAYRDLSGICRTVRGPSMSAFPGKVHVLGPVDLAGGKALALEYLQCRNPEMVRRPFFAKYSSTASWFDELEPLTEADAKFWPGNWDSESLSEEGIALTVGSSDE
ncbi:MAG: lysine 2,3-aminomutase [Planctomycetota bacterium]